MQDQEWFAEMSGDFNPVHLDPVVARRELSGAMVVHGVHLLLWALDAFFNVRSSRGARIAHFKCSFRAPVYLDVPVEIQVGSASEMGGKLTLAQNGRKTAKIVFELRPSRPRPPAPTFRRAQEWVRHASDLPLSNLLGKRGRVPLEAGGAEVFRRFARVAEAMGPEGILDLLAITRVVGMECPGWHSLLSAVELTVRPECSPDGLQYVVEEVDRRMGLVVMNVAGACLCGKTTVFHRPGRVAQIRFADARKRVQPERFSGQRALIIGGSRGLGETTAKLVAAGGGMFA